MELLVQVLVVVFHDTGGDVRLVMAPMLQAVPVWSC